MTATPPCEPDGLFQLAQGKIQELQRLTTEIQTQSQNPSLPVLAQLMFQREAQLSELTGMGLQNLPPEQQGSLLTQLEACQTLDPQIETQLRQLHQKLEVSMRQLKSSQTLIHKYKLNAPTENSSQSQNA